MGSEGITTCAANDIERATKMARAMVTKWGLSKNLGPLMYDEEDEEVFLGKSAGATRSSVSVDTASKIDKEVRTIIDDCYSRAKQLLEDNRDKLDIMAETLLEYETIDRGQIDDIMNGRKPRPPAGWGDKGSTPTESAASEEGRSSGSVGGPAADL